MIMIDSFGIFGSDLRRPEGVWATAEGIWCSDARGGLKFSGFDGSSRLLGTGIVDTNGFWRRADGSFVAAGLGDGHVWEIAADGATTKLDLLGGAPLGSPNAVCIDEESRIWVSVQTSCENWFDGLNAEPDGYVILKDHRGSRVVADRISCANELKVSPDGRFLYVVETLGDRILRYAIGEGDGLGPREVFAQFPVGSFPDGMTFDGTGKIWTALMLRNGIATIDAAGRIDILYDDPVPQAIDVVVEAISLRNLEMEMMGPCLGTGPLMFPTSIAFGGPDGRTAYVGSLIRDCLVTFNRPA